MSTLAALLALLLHAALLGAAAPLAQGGVQTLHARLLGRRGPALMQPWRDLLRLVRKPPLLAEQASFVSLGAPLLVLALTGLAALLVPSFALGMASAPAADLLLVAALLAAARLVLALAAMDVGSAPGGMGASRVMRLGLLGEPALLLLVLSFAWTTGGSNLDSIATTLRSGGLPWVPLLLALAALCVIILADAGLHRPEGARETAMTQAALGLEFSGWHLAAIEFAGALRWLVWLDLLGCLFLPIALAPPGAGPLGWGLALLVWGLRLAAGCAVLALLPIARARLARVPALLGAAVLLALLAAAMLLAGGRAA